MTFEDLTEEEIRFLIRRYKLFLKELRRELKKRLSVKRDEDIDGWSHSTDVKLLAKDVLSKLGYSKHIYYRREALAIIDKLYDIGEWKDKHSHYSNEELAVAVVMEVLDHDNRKVDFSGVIDAFYCDKKRVETLFKDIKSFCEEYHWKDIPKKER